MPKAPKQIALRLTKVFGAQTSEATKLVERCVVSEERFQGPEKFAVLSTKRATRRTEEHGGVGPIAFRRMFSASDFAAAIDFVDVTIIYPGSTIGRHGHSGNEEIYFILGGDPRVSVDGIERRLGRGDVTVVRSGQWHELVNDTESDVTIGVVQVRIP